LSLEWSPWINSNEVWQLLGLVVYIDFCSAAMQFEETTEGKGCKEEKSHHKTKHRWYEEVIFTSF